MNRTPHTYVNFGYFISIFITKSYTYICVHYIHKGPFSERTPASAQVYTFTFLLPSIMRFDQQIVRACIAVIVLAKHDFVFTFILIIGREIFAKRLKIFMTTEPQKPFKIFAPTQRVQMNASEGRISMRR